MSSSTNWKNDRSPASPSALLFFWTQMLRAVPIWLASAVAEPLTPAYLAVRAA
jgi:hypothetical protein